MAASSSLGEPLVAGGGHTRSGCETWHIIFYCDVFMACVSFSLVMPSLWLYLSGLRASRGFYAWVVAIYSVGEAIGSLVVGALSTSIGTKRSLVLCILISIVGAMAYALAGSTLEPQRTFEETESQSLASFNPAPWTVLVARLLQGIGSGGMQAVEQAYISLAAPPNKQTELTGHLSTFAVLGFIFGPAIGALGTQFPSIVFMGVLRIDSLSVQGWIMAALNLLMMLVTSWFHDVVADSNKRGTENTSHCSSVDELQGLATGNASASPVYSSVMGVWGCVAFFFFHFNGFAIQETITSPLVQYWFGWNATATNMLFVAAGILNLVCAVGLSILSAPSHEGANAEPRVEDRWLLVGSFVCASFGWTLMTFPPSIPLFLIAFSLITVAFPFGRGVCLAMVGKLLGDSPPGTWMGVMFALGAVARIIGPFWAVHGFFRFGALAVFGSTAALFCVALFLIALLWRVLSPPPMVHFEAHTSRISLLEDMSSMSPQLGLSPRIPHYHIAAE